MFPKKDDWPFPEYIGSCGRVIIESFEGETLSDLIQSSFYDRVQRLLFHFKKFSQKLKNINLKRR
jgi:hypothetical protein